MFMMRHNVYTYFEQAKLYWVWNKIVSFELQKSYLFIIKHVASGTFQSSVASKNQEKNMFHLETINLKF